MMPRYQGRCPDCRNLVWCVAAPRILLEPARGAGSIAVRMNPQGELLARALRHGDFPHSYEFRAQAHECPQLNDEQPLAVVLPFDLNRRRNRRKR